MCQQTFRKWKPGVWQAVNTGLYTLDELGEEDETRQVDIYQPGPTGELQNISSSHATVSFLLGLLLKATNLCGFFLQLLANHNVYLPQ